MGSGVDEYPGSGFEGSWTRAEEVDVTCSVEFKSVNACSRISK